MTSQTMIVEIDLGNQAFADGNRAAEIGRILGIVKQKVEDGHTDGVIHDVNGNRVGTWDYDPEETDDD